MIFSTAQKLSTARKRKAMLPELISVLALTLFCSSAIAQEPEELKPVSEEIQLFNGEDLGGWTFLSNDDEAMAEDVWTITDGVLGCKGSPHGYLQTKRWYRDYELQLDWRWPGDEGGNSGVLIHTTTPLVFYGWPKSIEAQLLSGNAGDFWVICKGVDLRVDNESVRRAKKVDGNQHSHRRIKRLEGDFEKPLGEWNTMRIVCNTDEIKVFVNDQLVNHGTDCTISEGAIALQSEGTAVEFRNIRVKPLSE